MLKVMLNKIEEIFNNWLEKGRDFIANPSANLAKLWIVFILAAITILSYLSVNTFYKVLSLAAISSATPLQRVYETRQPLEAAGREPLQNYGVITQRNLFQTTLRQTGGSPGAYMPAGEEIAEFDLKGTIAGGDEFGFIIIEERASKKQRLYRVGDTIGSSRLLKISRNSATIMRGGREVTLTIKHAPQAPLLSRSPASVASRRPRPDVRRQQVSMSKSAVTEKLQDLQAIMTQAKVLPYFEEGTQEGFIISEIKPGSLYQQLGLRNGDIIIDVNSQRMQSADDVMELVNIMQSGGNVVLNLKRQGKIETINYSFH
ncbi:MAG TPA: PDZ domain-containing protein [Deltaproteobacteria bacterium]|nr:PDZ domain-containing protein [Deltaproteobacteria bacterium]